MSQPNNVPAGGTYEIVDPLTRHLVASPTFDGLVQSVGRVRIAIGAMSGLDLRSEVERWVCEKYPEECTGVSLVAPRKRRLFLSDVLHGTKVMVAFKLAGNPLVSRNEAQRRGEICRHCEFNIRFDKPCTGWCPELASLVHAIIGHQGLPVDGYLHACNLCGCFNAAQIWLPLDILDKGLTDEMRKQFKAVKVKLPDGDSLPCWKQCGNVG